MSAILTGNLVIREWILLIDCLEFFETFEVKVKILWLFGKIAEVLTDGDRFCYR